MQRNGLVHQQLLGNQLVSVLAQLGLIDDALQSYGNLSHPMPSTWRSIIRSCVQWDLPDLALTLYENSQKTETSYFIGRTFISLIKACAKPKNVKIGCLLHDHVFHTHMLIRNPFVGSSLVDMYCKCGLLSEAKQVLDGLPMKDVVTWTTMIDGYAENGHSEEAVICLAEMQQAGIHPNSATFICVLKACINAGDLSKGKALHADARKDGYASNLVVGNTLMTMYGKCAALAEAEDVFHGISDSNIVSWNVLLFMCIDKGQGESALQIYKQKQENALDDVTLIGMLQACASMGSLKICKQLHLP
ncbi:hypothetical protein KP509_19G003900 [Ceratopteris richardii]|uniref:Pentatricopeptide repeat-containing protein n=1 Tax=Ceratopteris richardii TaxID=49495 RepID=A0A8T2SIB4_CERRI|nr:hypothetical protein KP509_19G003900 [Ceratopteris richardii]